MRNALLLAALFYGACAPALLSQAAPPRPSQDDSDFSADGTPLEKEPPSQEEKAAGHAFRDIYKPVLLDCNDWSASIKQAERPCAKSLFVDGCGEKDDAGKPTGQYRDNACPACDTLLRLRENARSAGCAG
mgnify:CR=1 FL=1